MSPVTEEDWARREMHRVACVVAVCKTKGFLECPCILESESFAAYLEREGPARLAALLNVQRPSPTNRSLSKRAFERAIQVWRRELRALGEFVL